MENEIVVGRSFTMAVFLVANPNVTVRVWENGKFTDFKYDVNTGKFMYHTPANKVRNGWYEARGLKGHFDSGMRQMLNKNSNDIISFNKEDLPY